MHFTMLTYLASVPMEESLATDHETELIDNPSPRLLNGGGVANKGGRHFEPGRGHVADGRERVVGDPFHKRGRVLVRAMEHLLVHLLGRKLPAEEDCAREVATATRVGGTHHVLGVEALLGSSGTERTRYSWDLIPVRGAKPTMKK